MNWSQFKQSAPDLASLAEERFQRHGLVLIGTLRRNGWPRISPVEPLVVEGVLYLGMTYRSHKALDLLSDPRITVQTIVSNKDGTEGEVKLYGRAEDVRVDRDPAHLLGSRAPRDGVRPAGGRGVPPVRGGYRVSGVCGD